MNGAAQAPPGAARGAADLTEALRSERRLLDRLLEVLDAQRSGVANDDLETLDGSVYDAQRVLLSLQQARRRRRGLLQLLLGREDVSLRALELELGPLMTEGLREAGHALETAAMRVARELEVNRRVIEGAFETGDRMIRALTGASPGAPLYSNDSRPGDARGRGLLDRTV